MTHACPECNNIDPSNFTVVKNGEEVTHDDMMGRIMTFQKTSHAVANLVCDECGYTASFSVTLKPQ